MRDQVLGLMVSFVVDLWVGKWLWSTGRHYNTVRDETRDTDLIAGGKRDDR